jgi:hypothetical protein
MADIKQAAEWMQKAAQDAVDAWRGRPMHEPFLTPRMEALEAALAQPQEPPFCSHYRRFMCATGMKCSECGDVRPFAEPQPPAPAGLAGLILNAMCTAYGDYSPEGLKRMTAAYRVAIEDALKPATVSELKRHGVQGLAAVSHIWGVNAMLKARLATLNAQAGETKA